MSIHHQHEASQVRWVSAPCSAHLPAAQRRPCSELVDSIGLCGAGTLVSLRVRLATCWSPLHADSFSGCHILLGWDWAHIASQAVLGMLGAVLDQPACSVIYNLEPLHHTLRLPERLVRSIIERRIAVWDYDAENADALRAQGLAVEWVPFSVAAHSPPPISPRLVEVPWSVGSVPIARALKCSLASRTATHPADCPEGNMFGIALLQARVVPGFRSCAWFDGRALHFSPFSCQLAAEWQLRR